MPDAAATNPKPQPESLKGPDPAAKGPARIALTKFELRENQDLPGSSQAKFITCGQTTPGRQFWMAYFVPAHQVIELEYYKHEKAEPFRRRIPISATLWFD